MKNIYLIIFTFILVFSKTLAQEDKIGAMKTQYGTLLYFNFENPYTVEIIGDVNLKSFPLIEVNNKNFQIISNKATETNLSNTESLKEYMKWEIDYLKETFSDIINTKSDIFTLDGKEYNFWYYKNPIIENPPADITPFKMTFLLDWKIDNNFYKIVFPSYNEDVSSAKSFLLEIESKIRYYSKKIDLEKLYENIQDGQNYYIE